MFFFLSKFLKDAPKIALTKVKESFCDKNNGGDEKETIRKVENNYLRKSVDID